MRLHGADVFNDQTRGEPGVLAQIFGVPAVQGCAHEVHARPEHDVLAALQRLLTDHLTVGLRGLGIPRGGQGDPHRETGREVIRAPGGIPAVRIDVLAHAVRPVGHPAPGKAEAQDRRRGELRVTVHEGDLFLERQAREQVLHARLDRLRRVEIGRPFLHPGGNSQQGQGDNTGEQDATIRVIHRETGRRIFPKLHCPPAASGA